MQRARSIAAALSAAFLSLVLPVTALADEPPPPEHRIELVGPSVGIGHFAVPSTGYSRGFGTLAIDLRYAHASGHGVMVRGAWGSNVWGEGYGLELDYLVRAILTGDRDLSLGLDFTLGPSAATLEHNEQTLAVGAYFGGNGGISLDFRAYNFVLSLGAQYRFLVPAGERLDGAGAAPAHVLTATLGAGVTFY